MRLRDRVALVTGGGSGIGQAICWRFAEEGADVVIADLRPEAGEETAARVRASGRRALVVEVDTADKARVEAMVAAALGAFGRIDILVNNAGTAGKASLFELSEERWDRVIDVNLKGPFLCTQVVARHMVERGGGGRIINITSMNAECALPDLFHYCASKGGLKMLTKCLALDLGKHGITVNAIGPGWTDTPMSRLSEADPERIAGILAQTAIPRVGTPLDIANAALYLASDEAAYVTGHSLYVDGGHLVL